MKILELELDLYKRLTKVAHIRHFKLTLKEIVQLILGTNGSGKSSILYELSPLPANHKAYHKGGKKRVLIAHQNKMYELISDFANGQDHYFYVDGENLNTGRTVTIQKELVKEHFGITFETHELLLGYEQFSKMSPARRRELFTMLCVVDYTYAIKLYQKIQVAMRDDVGTLKNLKKRLVTETANALKDEEITGLRVRLAELNRESQAMYMLRNANAQTTFDARTVAEAAKKTIDDLLQKFRSVRSILRDKCWITPDEYQEDIDSLRAELHGIEGVYARASEEFIKASSEVEQVSGLEAEDVTKLQDEIIASNKKAQSLLETRKRPLEGFKPLAASQSMELVYESLYSVLTELPADPEGQMSSQALSEVSERLRLVEMSISANREKLSGLEHREKHLVDLASSEDINCPKCEHSFKMGYSVGEHESIKTRIAAGRNHIEALGKEAAALKEQQERLSNYASLYKEYVRITRNSPELQPLWDLIVEEDALRRSPQHALTLIELVRSDLRIEMQVNAIYEKIATDDHRLKLAQYAQSEAIKTKKQRLEQLEQEIGRLSKQKVWVQGRLSDLVRTQQQIKHMYEVGDRMAKAKEEFTKASYAIIDAVKNEIIDEALAETHREIATLSTRIHSIDQHETLINDLKQQIQNHEKSEKAYKALADALSPTDGLIAEGMLGFIRNYVARMNALIAKVWTYKMEVHDCSTEDDSAELNYKFPVTIGNDPEPVPDVADSSSGQEEMLNLAFRVVAAQCLGLDKGPLPLDEFGKTFDESHREAATNVVRQLIEQLSFSQLFMISHYESSYGAFYNAQMSVIDKRNITVPVNRRYNEFTELAA
ncbi:putative SbcC-ATPase [Ralstonia phage RP31]|uniref:Putative SbcC-ATPase n=2 Tax=Ripduovirus RP12 TaxID=2560700 RepID=A0A1L7N0Q0_9CAUD|nr:putative SbcC-ATPase [Ralstonia phage RP12]BAW19043.1 putative SbcC-ATPase [Ralstonia phage RP12]BAW19328.1 putative SbcC-ATPase [Ralstonia phage RP31]